MIPGTTIPVVRSAKVAVAPTGPVALHVEPDVGDPILAVFDHDDAVVLLSNLARRVREVFGNRAFCDAIEPARDDLEREVAEVRARAAKGRAA